ncbi:hypothetical protein DFP72DRAFT_1061170 [Ephemerocybe angulata]|uniref:JmjC domain-containing protein n=1 Tax=Ephemerocybe angulata TaxID=980116 RepID=A0A8H6MDG9_9AGAR|nr:hypothetical protein DFP72DRAFT_1061170 [Tulosesus angulatus]
MSATGPVGRKGVLGHDDDNNRLDDDRLGQPWTPGQNADNDERASSSTAASIKYSAKSCKRRAEQRNNGGSLTVCRQSSLRHFTTASGDEHLGWVDGWVGATRTRSPRFKLKDVLQRTGVLPVSLEPAVQGVVQYDGDTMWRESAMSPDSFKGETTTVRASNEHGLTDGKLIQPRRKQTYDPVDNRARGGSDAHEATRKGQSRRRMAGIGSKARPSWWDGAIARPPSDWADPNLQPIRLRTQHLIPEPSRIRREKEHQLSRASDSGSTMWDSVKVERKGSRVWPGSSTRRCACAARKSRRALTGVRDKEVVAWGSAYKSCDSEFLRLFEKIEDVEKHPERLPDWGVYKPRDILNDEDAHKMPRVEPHRLQAALQEAQVVDALCAYKGYAGADGALKHEKQGYWIGESSYMDSLCDLKTEMTTFLSNARALNKFHVPAPSNGSSDPSLRLADEIAGTYRGRKALAVVRNLATVSFSLSVMKKGYLQVPDNVNELDLQPAGCSMANVEILMTKTKRIRQALHLVANISPLMAVFCGDLTKHAICLEELLINMKLFGNTRPEVIRRLERDVWAQLFDIAEGKRSALEGLIALQQQWETGDILSRIGELDSSYFKRDAVHLYTSGMSPYDAYLSRPLPPNVLLPPPAFHYIRPIQTPENGAKDVNVGNDNVSGGEEGAGGKTGSSAEKEKEKGEGHKGDEPTEPPPQGGRRSDRLAEKKDGPPEKPEGQQGPKKRRNKRRAPKSPRIVRSDGGEDDQENADLIMDWWDWEAAPPEQRVKLEEEVVETLEDLEVFVHSSSYGLKPPLNLEEITQKYSDTQDREFEVADGTGRLHRKKWFFHNKEDHDAWTQIYDVARRPEHLFHCITHAEYQALSTSEVQAIFATKNIVITGTPGPNVLFDLAGLETLADRHQRIELQDQSVPITDGNFFGRARTGIVQDLYDISSAPWEKKKSVNALSFPNPDAGITATPFASDVRASQRTRLDVGCHSVLPIGDIRWGLAATEGAHSYWHIDTQGECTFLRISFGEKAWVIAEPKDGNGTTSTLFWTHPKLDVMKISLKDFNVEVVVLNAGDTLLMRSNTLHCAYTLEDSICHGGYFLSSGCLRRTVCGAAHTFFESRIATNTEGPAYVGRMNTLATFFHKTLGLNDIVEGDKGHLPDVSTVEGLTNLLLFACGIEMLNALSRDSYHPVGEEALGAAIAKRGMDTDTALDLYDISEVSHETRLHNACSRGRMQDLLERIFVRYTIVDEDGQDQDGWTFLWIPTFAWFIHALKDYYDRSLHVNDDDSEDGGSERGKDEESEEDAVPMGELFSRQMEWSASRWPELKSAVEELADRQEEVSSLVWDFPNFTIRSADAPRNEPDERTPLELFKVGLRVADSLYLAARQAFINPSGKPYVKRGGSEEEDWVLRSKKSRTA